MSIHNTEHNSPLNSDHDDDIHDSVNKISNLDISDPLHFHPNDNTALTVVSIKLNVTENYQVWSCAMLLALEGKNKIDFIDESCKKSNIDEKNNQNFNAGPSRPSNVNNNKPSGGSGLVCKNYGFNGHTIDRWFKIIGYPVDFGKKKSGQVLRNKGKSDSSSSSESGCNINTADFLVDFRNDADSSNDFVATQNEEVATFEENVFSEASKYSHWIDAMNLKMNALLRNGTWELVELPEGRKSIGSKWIYKIKFRSSGEIDTKQRLVAHGFRQKEGIDYEKTFSPVVKMVTIRIGCLYETTRRIYPSNNKVRRLKKSLYGLKQDSRQWNAKLISTLIENGFSQSKFDYSLYTKSGKKVFLTLLVYVKILLLFTGNSLSEIEKFKVFLKSKFMIKDLGKLQYFLEIEVVDTNKAIQIAVNLVFHERAKHLEIDLHFVREKVLKGLVKTVKVDSANQITDILTKGLDIV
nr:ribonuclease H-like domain-containing protein [Tanacetum cinerariifolium]